MTGLDLDAVEAMHPDEPGINPFVRPLLAELREARADADLLRDTLRVISEWDAINPPPADGSDLPWLRRVVDGAFPGGAPATAWQHIVADRDEARAAIARVREMCARELDPRVSVLHQQQAMARLVLDVLDRSPFGDDRTGEQGDDTVEAVAHVVDLMHERDEARAAIARVRALHVDTIQPTVCDICEHDYRMPCVTLRALDGAS